MTGASAPIALIYAFATGFRMLGSEGQCPYVLKRLKLPVNMISYIRFLLIYLSLKDSFFINIKFSHFNIKIYNC